MKTDIDIYVTINSLKRYFYSMIKMNNKLIELLFFKGYDNFQKADLFLEVCDLIFKIIPTKLYNDNNIKIDEKAGILLIQDLKQIILPHFEKLKYENSDILTKMKKLRNKFEHEPHNIDSNFILSGNNSYRGFSLFNYIYKDEEISISTDELIKIINGLNKCFSDIQKTLANYRDNVILNKDIYYHRLINEHFCEIIIK